MGPVRSATLLLVSGSTLSGLGKLLILGALSAVIPEAAGTDRPDFSGSYTLTGTKGASKTKRATASLLQVIQTGAEIEVSRTFDGKAYLNRLKLDGTEGEYRSEGGAQGTSTARFKGKALIIDTQVTTRPQANGPAVQIHTRERWTLSSDLRTLIIRSDVDFPNSGLGGFQVIEPWSEIYTRNQSPVASPSQTQSQKDSGPLRLTLQKEALVFQMTAPGFAVTQNVTQPDGRRYLLATNELSNSALSIKLESVIGKATLDGCRDVFRGRTVPGGPFKLAEISESKIGEMAVLEYMIPVANGVALRQKNLFGCLVKDDVYADIHLSKAGFRDEDEPSLKAILATAMFTGAAADAVLLFDEGSAYFGRDEYEKAIGPYQKALDREKAAPKLPQPQWRALIDNLAMAYGITGRLDAADEVLKYGALKEPDYPMFYFITADICAERNDLDATMKFLRLALKFRDNMNRGEKLPDPLTDDSFKRFYENLDFRKLAAEFGKARRPAAEDRAFS